MIIAEEYEVQESQYVSMLILIFTVSLLLSRYTGLCLFRVNRILSGWAENRK